MRHTYITNLILGGTNIKVVQYLAGHAKVETTLNIYTHLMQNRPEDNIGYINTVFGAKMLPESVQKITPKITPN